MKLKFRIGIAGALLALPLVLAGCSGSAKEAEKPEAFAPRPPAEESAEGSNKAVVTSDSD